MEVRVLVVAPSIDRATLGKRPACPGSRSRRGAALGEWVCGSRGRPYGVEHVNKINYQVELIEITRWASGRDTWLLVNRLEPFPPKKKRPVSGLTIYDRAAYEEKHKPEVVRAFLQTCDDLQEIASRRNWPVERKFNKYYCGFKVGNYIVFGVKWISGKSFGIFLKVPEAAMRRFKIAGFESKYEPLWNQAVYRPGGSSFSLVKLKPLLERALEARVD